MNRKISKLIPADENGQLIYFEPGEETEILIKATTLASKRTRRILRDAAYGSMTLSQLVESAYIQGLTDAGLSISS